MLTPEQIDAYCLSKPGAYVDFPFGPAPACYKVKGKIFAQLYTDPRDYKLTVKCNPEESALLRGLYEGAVVRAYHCPAAQQPYWNTVYVARIDDGVLMDMMDIAFVRVVEKLPRRVRAE